MRLTTCSFIWICVSLAAGVASGQEPVWPRVLSNGGMRIVVHQPQPDSFAGPTLESRVAVSIQRPQDKAPLYDALWMVTTLDINGAPDLVRVVSVKVERTLFAGVPETDIPLVRLLENEPRLQTAGSSGLQPVVNTALPVIFDPGSRRYWLYGSSGWFTNDDLLRGKWTWSDRAPSNVADLGIVYRTLKNKWVFEDFPNFIVAEAS